MGTEGVGSGCARVIYPRVVAISVEDNDIIGALVVDGLVRRMHDDVMLMRCMLRSKHFDAIFYIFNQF